ncbi:hypothetical protein AYL99_10256 [Fonsecaea erecta]|uniref:Uncharacterized protein n=1 Tax=Fonsecaea erecta TaxID=1367422 RepID=A0A178Z7Y3_9EURO|nr:hypothetical protein AYL99_10256 [Fonsecaea erecta]OAP55283.1 hypothetical protein AYL99_10256 [Fonsecaea erecta]
MLPPKEPNTSSTTTTFTLPLRAAPAKSLTLDPYFTLLYEDNKTALHHFLHDKAPLPVKDILATPRFVEYVLSKEPGPKVQYENLRPALTAIRSFLLSSSGGKRLLAFYKHLLQIQGRWLIATAELVGFELYVKLTHALFISRDDKKLLAHFVEVIPDTVSKVADYSTLDKASFDSLFASEKSRLQEACFTATDGLFDFKVSRAFYHSHGKLLTAIEIHEAKLQELRERAERRRAERQARIQAAYARNSATVYRQMGMGARLTHTPHADASICEYTKRIFDEFLSFGGEAGADVPLQVTEE